MRVGRGSVAHGSVGGRLIFGANGEKMSALDTTADPTQLPGVEAITAMHPTTAAEVALLAQTYRGYPTGERIIFIRKVEAMRSGVTESGEVFELMAPSQSDARQNRGIIIRSGPDATQRVRLVNPLEDGTTKVVVELLPGDEIEPGQYAMAEVQVEQHQSGREILVCMARDITQVIDCAEIRADRARGEAHVSE